MKTTFTYVIRLSKVTVTYRISDSRPMARICFAFRVLQLICDSFVILKIKFFTDNGLVYYSVNVNVIPNYIHIHSRQRICK
jgi:hypothetical protein